MESEKLSNIWQPNSIGEYRFDSSEHSESHDYLIPSLMKLTRAVVPGATVLDFGCGNGSFIAAFRERGWNLHGIDISKSGIEHSRSAYPFVNFSVADVAAENFTHPLAGKCDLLISTEVVEHVMLPRWFAKNCYLMLKPGGQLIVTTPYHGYLKNLSLALTGQFDHHFHALWDYGHIKFWSRKTLTRLLEEAGFQMTGFSGSGRLPYLWKSMVIKCSKPVPPKTQIEK